MSNPTIGHAAFTPVPRCTCRACQVFPAKPAGFARVRVRLPPPNPAKPTGFARGDDGAVYEVPVADPLYPRHGEDADRAATHANRDLSVARLRIEGLERELRLVTAELEASRNLNAALRERERRRLERAAERGEE
ncbi:MAG: hypothetical protein FJ298_14215 [Planctomycetes bacterium]|nr:hypothetical protein [Planctomycetota bacterium]